MVTEFLTPEQAASYLGISRVTIYRLVADRQIKFSRASQRGRIRFRKQWLDEFVERGAEAPVTTPEPKPYEADFSKW